MIQPATLPPPVRTGDRVGVAALSGPVAAEDIERGLEALAEIGFEPVPASNLRLKRGFFAGSDDERLTAFHELIEDDALAAVVFARGGHGLLRLLPRLDWDLLRRRPRAYVGYSDLTPLLNLLVTRFGLAAFHGPMVGIDLARGLEPGEKESLLTALGSREPQSYEVAGHGERVEGPLVGGCLSLVTAVLATRFEMRPDGAILFWEDVDEPLYRLDRMLTQLQLSGSLAAVKGMVVGRIEHREACESEVLASLLEEWSRQLGVPVVYGVSSGHCRPNFTLTLGRPVRLEPERGRLTCLP